MSPSAASFWASGVAYTGFKIKTLESRLAVLAAMPRASRVEQRGTCHQP